MIDHLLCPEAHFLGDWNTLENKKHKNLRSSEMCFLGGLKYRNKYSITHGDKQSRERQECGWWQFSPARLYRWFEQYSNTCSNFRPSYIFARLVNLVFKWQASSLFWIDRFSQNLSVGESVWHWPTRMMTGLCQTCKWEDSDIIMMVLCSRPANRHGELCEYSYRSRLCMGVCYQACIS